MAHRQRSNLNPEYLRISIPQIQGKKPTLVVPTNGKDLR